MMKAPKSIKFTGSKKNNGYSKKTTRYYYKYHCRCCGRSYHRDEVHEAITGHLKQITFTGQQQKELIEALSAVWAQKQRDQIQTLKAHEEKIQRLIEMKSKLILELVNADASYKDDIKAEIDKIKAQIEDEEAISSKSSELEEDLIAFTKFALEYTNQLAEDWWELSHEDRVRCQQLIFPGGIYFNSQKKVGTPIISPIYRLEANKKDLSFSEKSLMVELPGTAPGSVGV